MSENKNNKNEPLVEYISKVDNQEIKVLLLKLKNEINKPDVTWEQIKNIISNINDKDPTTVNDIIELIIYD